MRNDRTGGRLMRRWLILSTMLLVMTVALVTSAQAAPPELGRCVHVGSEGTYRNDGCTEKASGTSGEYRWLPGPGEAPAFSANMGFNEVPFAEIVTANKHITCFYNPSEGEYTGPKTLKMFMYLWQCHLPFTGDEWEWNKLCQEPTYGNRPPGSIVGGRAESEIGEMRFEVTGTLGFYEGSKVGIELKPAAGSVLTVFECGGASQTVQLGTGTGTVMELEGGVIGRWLLTNGTGTSAVNHMETFYKVRYAATGGKQEPEKLDGAPTDTMTLISPIVGLERASEPATYSAEEEVETEEPIELNTHI
jgi:hypothetical protein